MNENQGDRTDGDGTGEPGTLRTDGDGIRGTAAGTAPVPLSVLDLVTVGQGRTATQALRTGVEIAKLTEARGFHRYWVAEHHSMPGVASSSPAVLLAHIAAHTDRIRLGSGGVMLPNHAPLVIAEQFGTLEAMAPGRIDLGLGRAPGTDGATAAALRRSDRLNEGADDFPQQLSELIRFLDDDFPDGHPYARIHAVPGPVQATAPGGVQSAHRPPVWLLGSSGFSARLAGTLGLPFAFAHHFSARNTIPALDLYRSSFRPSAVLDAPYALIGVSALAADEEAEARRQVLTGALSMVRLRTGRPGLIPSPEEAAAYDFSPMEREFVDGWLADVIHGTADEVRTGLDDLAKRTGADELMITANAHGGEARLRSYELIADAYGLPRAA
ncbi:MULTISPECIES: LLM class flavin-dependent oxidoreductase [Streptomyces]|uniref:LLM class flavin-dependent oxidoreductase n=1 Tax=Streptomyces TaxID=1883 RepID=UPI00103DD390|nr:MULTISPECIES: LLM class flavin-dependent oxidoreductase [Streptomyces]MBT3073467.1 LLM class flavin-dependent oxidoreductase [Streptomyces sp. COG21]MBT3083376.1 LLM class flavin-dependent oxidoreductase [Streptomyces sp. COG20]MBT3088563.1 LLM class flavin-dependent oxidoreductase [Streptomyces sp. CYG21]MBT3098380.1 LLM class flavin-dependent oxidoreductase [Streptomyces sp. CBG30]MBT3101986.1 LLM class flavin-dependent oxidoreductase [Streptomyces sp. COG19]